MNRTDMNRTSRTLLCAALAALTACEFGVLQVVDPPPPEPVDLTLVLVPAEADEAVAQLGWAGTVPRAEVRLLTEDQQVVWSGMSDDAGRASVGRTPSGRYIVEVRRLLDEAERTRSGDAALAAFAERRVLQIGTADRAPLLQVFPSRRSGLVFSEIYGLGHIVPGVGSYQFATYYELYNNSDAIQYLDGVIVAAGYRSYWQTNAATCAEQAEMVLQTHYFSRSFYRFPGTGTQYPVQPGQVVLLATDAIDHSVVDPTWPDLSRADWEFVGSADVDNPHVPNILNAGHEPGYTRGVYPTYFTPDLLVGSVDLESLPSRELSGRWVAFPREVIVDLSYNAHAPGLEPCPHRIPAVFDREPAQIPHTSPRDGYASVHRRVLGHMPDGRPILQHTRSSFADFMPGRRSPGTVGVIEPVPPH